MPVEIQAPDGSLARFPDGTPDEEIMRVMRETFGGPGAGTDGPKENRTSAFQAGIDGVSQGLTFGFSDEIEAGGKAALRKLLGGEGDLGQLYDEGIKNARERIDASAEEHPLAYYGGEIGSSFAVPGGLAKLGIRGAVRAAEGAGVGTRMLAGAKEGAAYGAAYGAGKSEGGLEERATGALGGAAFGGAIGGATPAVIDAASAMAQPVVNQARSVLRPQAEAARRVEMAMDADIAARGAQNVTPQEIARNQTMGQLIQDGRLGDDLRNIDVGGGNAHRLARSAANQSPDAERILHQSNAQRFEGQAGRAVDFLRSLVPTPGSAPQTREALQNAGRRARGPLYDAAYQAGANGITTPGLRQLANSDAVQAAMRTAVRNLSNKAVAHRGGHPQGPQGPTLEFWDQVSRELRDQYTTLSRQGANEAAADIQGVRRRLLDELDAAVPEFRQARGVAAQYFRADDALEAGENFASARGNFTPHDARRALGNMSEAEQEAFREGFISRLVDNIERTGDRRNILGRLAESPRAREHIEVALGPNRARELEAFLYLEQLKDLPRQAMGNSTTTKQLMDLGLASGAGVLTSGGDWTDPRAWIVGGLTYGVQRGRNRVNQDLQRHIAEMLVSTDEAVFRRGMQQLAHHGGMIDSLRALTAALGRKMQTAAAGLVGGTVAAQDATQRLQTIEGAY